MARYERRLRNGRYLIVHCLVVRCLQRAAVPTQLLSELGFLPALYGVAEDVRADIWEDLIHEALIEVIVFLQKPGIVQRQEVRLVASSARKILQDVIQQCGCDVAARRAETFFGTDSRALRCVLPRLPPT